MTPIVDMNANVAAAAETGAREHGVAPMMPVEVTANIAALPDPARASAVAPMMPVEVTANIAALPDPARASTEWRP